MTGCSGGWLDLDGPAGKDTGKGFVLWQMQRSGPRAPTGAQTAAVEAPSGSGVSGKGSWGRDSGSPEHLGRGGSKGKASSDRSACVASEPQQ